MEKTRPKANETQKHWNFATQFFKRHAETQYEVKLPTGAKYTVCKPMSALGILRDSEQLSERSRGRGKGITT